MPDTPHPIPQCSPLAAYQAQAAEIDAAVHDTLTDGRYVLGPRVASFERRFAAWIGVKHAIGVGNGTDAIEITLRALGIGRGDAVITTSMTAVATAAAIRRTGAVPVFADIDDAHGLIDPALVDALFDACALRIRAIVPVHLYGRCVNMGAIMAIADRRGAVVIEDCAQAHGAQWDGRPAGSFGAAGTFSFYPTKNLGAIGDGGAIVCNDDALDAQVRLLREYGWKQRYISDIEGGNSRLDELQAAILAIKLSRLDADNVARRAIANVYRERITHPAIQIDRGDDTGHVYHQFTLLTRYRDSLQAHLSASGISTLVHYPAAIHRQHAYANPRFAPLPLPNTERWSATVLSLPMFPQMPLQDAERVADAINSWDTPH